MGRKESVTRIIAGREVVFWRNSTGGLIAGPGACPHLGALLEQPIVPTTGARMVAQVIGTGPTTRPLAMPEVFQTLIYAAQRHGRARDVVYLELEVRNDLIATPERARVIAPRIARALDVYAGAESR